VEAAGDEVISPDTQESVMSQQSQVVSLPQLQIKQKLVDAIRMLERADYIDHNGHCSARRDATSFYVNSGASVRSKLTVDDIVAIDLEGNLVEGTAKPPLEFPIHAEVYRVRPEVNAVFHTHPKWSTFLTMTGIKYQPVYAQGVLVGDMPVMDSPLSVNTKPMGEKMVSILGKNPALLLKAHGVVTVGADIVEAFVLAAYVEENAYRQYMAQQIGQPYVFTPEEQQACREKLWSASLFKKTWDHYYSKL
jgi:L-fuculose-phosphate aldolase